LSGAATPETPEKSGVFARVFPCTSCGARLTFAPGTTTLRCEFCGAANHIAEPGPEAAGAVEEIDLESVLRGLEEKAETWAPEEVRCDKCGSVQKLEENLFSSHCAFCGSGIVSQGYASRQVRPRAILPFRLDHETAQAMYRRWLGRRWLAPGDLKRYARRDETLTGVYLPFWTYDSRTTTVYVGERGTKRDKTTTWERVTGRIEMVHDDVVVAGSRSLEGPLAEPVSHWDFTALVPYQPHFVSGFRAEAYQVGLAEGFGAAVRQMDARILEAIRRDIGGDAQKVDSVQTSHAGITFKHVLLPAWISAYRYRDRVYRFVVNAHSGAVGGESPYSWIKVTLLVIAGLVLLYFWGQAE
jgi:LSD1 subclass zinc finger protein